MNAKKLPSMFVCPIDRTPLEPADGSLLGRLNRAIAAGRVKNRVGRRVERPLEAGLIRADHAFLYPILDGIPLLLADEAIPMAEIHKRDKKGKST